MGARGQRFDDQADAFDRRAGLAPEVGRAVARAVVAMASPGDDEVVLDLGAGTGEIGRHLAPAVHYLGVDSSQPMLEVFRAKLPTAPLVRCDAELAWPIRDRSVAAVLASRMAHLLDPRHLSAELARVCRPGAAFLVGRVERDPGSVKSRLRRQRRLLLQERGLTPGDGAAGAARIVDLLVAGGAVAFETRAVASWTVVASPADVLAGWETMTTAEGVALPDSTRASILDALKEWARAAFGDLDLAIDSTERYTLGGARLDHMEDAWTTRS